MSSVTPNIHHSKSMTASPIPNTLFSLPEDLGFMFQSSPPFNIVPGSGVSVVAGSVLYTLRMRAEPVNKNDWQGRLVRGETVRFRGVQAGTNELIEQDAKAVHAGSPKKYLIISFSPVAP